LGKSDLDLVMQASATAKGAETPLKRPSLGKQVAMLGLRGWGWVASVCQHPGSWVVLVVKEVRASPVYLIPEQRLVGRDFPMPHACAATAVLAKGALERG
jgi:hypothetical protein